MMSAFSARSGLATQMEAGIGRLPPDRPGHAIIVRVPSRIAPEVSRARRRFCARTFVFFSATMAPITLDMLRAARSTGVGKAPRGDLVHPRPPSASRTSASCVAT